MKPVNFDYVLAESVQEACDILHSEAANARILAGGQSLGAMLNMRIATPSVLIDINRIAGLDEIVEERRFIKTGAVVRQAAALASPVIGAHVPLLVMALPYVGHFQTRSRGTLAGSVAHADPSAELPLTLALLNGQVQLASRRKSRNIPAREFFVSSLTTIKGEDEMITGLLWPKANPGDFFGFQEHAMRAGDFALVAAACHLDLASRLLSFGFGGCSDKPQIFEVTLPAEPGPQWADELAETMQQKVQCRSDLHASGPYRSALVGTMTHELASKVVAAAGRS